MKINLSNQLRRGVYLLGGLAFVALAIKDQQWWIGLFGLYFMAMAIFKFGCAAGNCSSTGCGVEPKEKKELPES